MENFTGYFKKEKWGKIPVLFILIFLSPSPSHAGSIRDTVRNIVRMKSAELPLHFAVLGDSRDGDNVYTQLTKSILARKPDFVIHLGDMISKPSEKEWRHFFEISNSIDIPFFPTAGNHDVGTTRPGEELYRKQFVLPGGKAYYAFRAGGGLFVILDSEEDRGRIGEEQKAWLKETLSSADAGFKLGFLHRPLYLPADSLKVGRAMDRYPLDRDDLHRLFIRMKINAVFAADDHRYDRREIEHLPYIITGGGGAPLSSFKERGGYYHYLWMTIQKGKMEGDVVGLTGVVQDKFVIEW